MTRVRGGILWLWSGQAPQPNLRWRGPWFAISAVSGTGCRELSFAAMEFLESDEVRKQGLALEALEADATAAATDITAVGGVGHEH